MQQNMLCSSVAKNETVWLLYRNGLARPTAHPLSITCALPNLFQEPAQQRCVPRHELFKHALQLCFWKWLCEKRRWIQQWRNTMLEYVVNGSGITQVFSRDNFDQLALWCCDAFAFAQLVQRVVLLLWCQRVFQKYSSQVVVRRVANICSSAEP